MQLRVFSIPLHAGDEHQDDMNRFLRSHRVLSVDKRFTDFISRCLLPAV